MQKTKSSKQNWPIPLSESRNLSKKLLRESLKWKIWNKTSSERNKEYNRYKKNISCRFRDSKISIERKLLVCEKRWINWDSTKFNPVKHTTQLPPTKPLHTTKIYSLNNPRYTDFPILKLLNSRPHTIGLVNWQL